MNFRDINDEESTFCLSEATQYVLHTLANHFVIHLHPQGHLN